MENSVCDLARPSWCFWPEGNAGMCLLSAPIGSAPSRGSWRYFIGTSPSLGCCVRARQAHRVARVRSTHGRSRAHLSPRNPSRRGRLRRFGARPRALVDEVASLDLITARQGPGMPVGLRWIMRDAIEEYARHNRHAELPRERTDPRDPERSQLNASIPSL